MSIRKDTNLILNELISGEEVTVRQDTNALMNALYDGTASLNVNVSNLPSSVLNDNDNLIYDDSNTDVETRTIYEKDSDEITIYDMDTSDPYIVILEGDQTGVFSAGDLIGGDNYDNPGPIAYVYEVSGVSYSVGDDQTSITVTTDPTDWYDYFDTYAWKVLAITEQTGTDVAIIAATNSTNSYENSAIIAGDSITANADNTLFTTNIKASGGISSSVYVSAATDGLFINSSCPDADTILWTKAGSVSPISVILPEITDTNLGKTYAIKFMSAPGGSSPRISTTASQLIDGAATKAFSSQYETIKVIAAEVSGTKGWWII